MPPRTEREIEQWMVRYIAAALSVDAEQIRLDAPFEQLGLDSTAAVGMTGDLEDWLGIQVDPTACYDYPTVETMAAYLVRFTAS